MSEAIEQKLQEKSLFDDILDSSQVELTKKNIEKAAPNSVSVANNGFAYDEYFKMGGTIAKLTFQSTKNFKDFIKNRSAEKANQ